MILIVEDNQDTVDLLQRVLKRQGLDSQFAANGLEALRLLREAPTLPRLILLDLMMPVMNGWEFMTEKMADARLAAIPVIVCSTVEPGGLGSVGYLAKPVEPAVLLERVRALVGNA